MSDPKLAGLRYCVSATRPGIGREPILLSPARKRATAGLEPGRLPPQQSFDWSP